MKNDRVLIIRLKSALTKISYLNPNEDWVKELTTEIPSTPNCSTATKQYWLGVCTQASISLLERGNLCKEEFRWLGDLKKNMDEWVSATQNKHIQ
jgi:hypothetical protein